MITLEQIKTEQAKIADMIAKLEAQDKVASLFPLTR